MLLFKFNSCLFFINSVFFYSVVRCRGRGGKIIRRWRNERQHKVVRDQPAVHQENRTLERSEKL